MKFIDGDTLLIVLIVEYCIIATVYGINHDWAKMLYFIGATILSVGVLWMKS